MDMINSNVQLEDRIVVFVVNWDPGQPFVGGKCIKIIDGLLPKCSHNIPHVSIKAWYGTRMKHWSGLIQQYQAHPLVWIMESSSCSTLFTSVAKQPLRRRLCCHPWPARLLYSSRQDWCSNGWKYTTSKVLLILPPGLQLQKENIRISPNNNSQIPHYGSVTVRIQHGSITCVTIFYVVETRIPIIPGLLTCEELH